MKRQYKYHYTYKLTFKPDTRYYYYGKRSTNSLNDIYYLGSGTTVRDYRQRYGSNCFYKEILKYWNSSEEALAEEAKLVGNLWKTDPFCLNNCPGGAQNGKVDKTGKVRIFKGNEERCINESDLELYSKDGWLRGRSKKTRQKNSERHKGKLQSDLERLNRSISMKNKWSDPGYRAKQMQNRSERFRNHLQKLLTIRLGQITVEKEGHRKFIDMSLLQEYKDCGWIPRRKDLRQ